MICFQFDIYLVLVLWAMPDGNTLLQQTGGF